jgi:hypothetical protein
VPSGCGGAATRRSASQSLDGIVPPSAPPSRSAALLTACVSLARPGTRRARSTRVRGVDVLLLAMIDLLERCAASPVPEFHAAIGPRSLPRRQPAAALVMQVRANARPA